MKKLMNVLWKGGYLFIALLLVLSACSSASDEPPVTLEGTPWLLEKYLNSSGKEETVLVKTVPTALFQDGAIEGYDGCNNFTATYTVNGSNLTIIPGMSTMMACPEDVMMQANTIIQNMANSSSYQIDRKELFLLDSMGNKVLTYLVANTALPGTTWSLISYNNGQDAQVSVILGSEITLNFLDGEVTGKTGCNGYTGPYTTQVWSLSIGPLATTGEVCSEPEGVMEQEAAYLAAIQQADHYSISQGRLTVFDSEGVIMVNMTSK